MLSQTCRRAVCVALHAHTRTHTYTSRSYYTLWRLLNLTNLEPMPIPNYIIQSYIMQSYSTSDNITDVMRSYAARHVGPLLFINHQQHVATHCGLFV